MIKKYLIAALVLPLVCGGATPGTRIELTAGEPTGSKWSSLDVSVLGFWLGQARKEAFATARNHSGELWDHSSAKLQRIGDCSIASCRLVVLQIYGGAKLDFDAAGLLSGIRIDSSPSLSSAVNAARQVKGTPGELLSNYSNSLRLELFGKAERTVDDPPIDENFITYFYDSRGISIRVQRATDQKGPYGPPLIYLCLYRPNGVPCKQW
jgi:hypothetical protein